MLKYLHLRNVGPMPELDMEFGRRLNLLTGDNGLGKTFVLDVAWWALTNTWAGNSAHPDRERGREAGIIYHWLGDRKERSYQYDWLRQTWPRDWESAFYSGLVIYAQTDGRFSVWDAARIPAPDVRIGHARMPMAFHFSPDALWNGLHANGNVLCNGLLADWVKWQYQPDQDEAAPFRLLERSLERLSPPHPDVWLRPGKPTRVSIEDVRDVPTIEMPYGTVPVTEAAAGMKRILGLAYLLVWAWYEHTRAVQITHQEPTKRLTLLVDEVEMHLHPRWQRSLLPTILEIGQMLHTRVGTQIIATTHSPLILASVEPYFKETQDRLFLFDLHDHTVTFGQVPWIMRGDVIGWLTSPIFGLEQARSREAEQSIEAAEAWMRKADMSMYPPNLRTQAEINRALARLLPGDDPFWPRWLVTTDSLPKN